LAKNYYCGVIKGVSIEFNTQKTKGEKKYYKKGVTVEYRLRRTVTGGGTKVQRLVFAIRGVKKKKNEKKKVSNKRKSNIESKLGKSQHM